MDFTAIRETAVKEWEWLENLPQPLIQIGMGTCGRASGAEEVLSAVRNKLKELKATLRERMHWSIPNVGKWLRSVITGHNRYYGVPWNGKSLYAFRSSLTRMWYNILRRRSQKGRITWKRMGRLAKKWLPNPVICHPYPMERMRVNT